MGEWKKIEECKAGDVLDMGVYVCIDPRTEGQGENTLNVRLNIGKGEIRHYTESKDAMVRIHGFDSETHNRTVIDRHVGKAFERMLNELGDLIWEIIPDLVEDEDEDYIDELLSKSIRAHIANWK